MKMRKGDAVMLLFEQIYRLQEGLQAIAQCYDDEDSKKKIKEEADQLKHMYFALSELLMYDQIITTEDFEICAKTGEHFWHFLSPLEICGVYAKLREQGLAETWPEAALRRDALQSEASSTVE